MNNHLHEILYDLERLPMMPKVVMEIICSIDDDSASIDMLTKQISSDIGLTASLLKMANTSRVMVHGGITSVHDAIMLVGFRQIRNMACVAGLLGNTLGIKHENFNYIEFWESSIGVGVCASILVRKILNEPSPSRNVKLNPDVAFITGILHDIGRLALFFAATEEFNAIEKYRQEHQCYLIEAEQAILGMDHGQIGAHLSRKWGFPEIISQAIEKHHQPDQPPHNHLADVLHVSEAICHALEIDKDEPKMPPLSDCAIFRLNMNFTQIKPYLAQIECEYQDLVLMLD